MLQWGGGCAAGLMLFVQVGVMAVQSTLGPTGGLRGQEGDRTESSVVSPGNGPAAWSPTSNGWTLSCRGSWHGPQSGQVLQLKQDGPRAERCWGLPNSLKPGLQTGLRVSSKGVSSVKQEQVVTRSCEHRVKSAWMFWHFSVSWFPIHSPLYCNSRSDFL